MRSLLDQTVIVSPHLDDAVLSLGASIARATRSGRRVTILTVFAGDPESEATAGGWDSRGGFATEGEATRARRLEDEEACQVVGAEPIWLRFSEAEYAATKDEDEVWSALADAVTPAASALIPGFPLSNPDHAWLTDLVVRRGLPCGRIGLYAEQPYRYWERGRRRRLELPASLERHLAESGWTRPAGSILNWKTKRQAILAYRSQLPLLGLAQNGHRKLRSMLCYETFRGGEAIIWLSET